MGIEQAHLKWNQVKMPSHCYQIAINQELGVIVISFQGKIYPKDMVDLLEELFNHQDYRIDFPTVYDFSGKNAITDNKFNYYEISHYRYAVGDSILSKIYQ